MALATFAVIAMGSPPLDARGHPIAADLLARVSAGAVALSGQPERLYDVPTVWDASRRLLGTDARALTLYTAPPFLALLYAPFALLPYPVAALAWTLLTVAVVVASLRLLWPLVPSLHGVGFGTVVLVSFSFYPLVELLGDGQDAALSLLLLAAGLRLLLARRDVPAGAVLGLGVFKPQLFLLVPVWLLARRRWGALGAWCAVAAAFALVSLALVGLEGARSYAALLGSDVYNASERGVGWKMLSLLGPVRPLVPSPAILPVTLAVTAVGAAAVWLVTRRSDDVALSFALLVLLIALLSPKVMLYDYAILLVPALLIAHAFGAQPGVQIAFAALWVLLISAAGRQAAFGASPWPVSTLSAQWSVVPVAYLAWRVVEALRVPARAAVPANDASRPRRRRR